MLNTIRKNAASWVVKVLMLLLVASFAIWGIGDIFYRGGQNPTVATVGDAEIPASELAEVMRSAIGRTYDALGKFQHREKGIWHLVIDEPDTRLETSATSAFIYCYDRLREMDMISTKYSDMVERAFIGLKRRYYHAGVAGSCRGTGFGASSEYYRTRPMGWFAHPLFHAAMAKRADS